ncbi:MAG: hypothetical protein A2040_12520 [Rhodocyclales bacterium GWA2_65_19]|nr:MAG: hypothetical protein A2040_12520 [Rhodocyclales bacterium GWA2_65_19]
MNRRPASAAGFTLIEAIMVIVITGILAGVVAVFITKPVEGYVDSVRRAELTDTADVVLRRMMRDIRLSLPNSLRVTSSGGVNYIEFIMTSAGGRYRDPADGSSSGDFLSFTSSTDLSFDVLGTMPASPAVAVNDYVAVYNLGPGYEPGNAYNYNGSSCLAGGCNIAKVSGVAGNVITLDANPFAAQTPPLPSPSARFQVIPGAVRAVTFACPTTGTGSLTRYWNYGFNTAQATPPTGGNSAPLANGASCVVEYTANATGRNGLLFVQLTLSSGGENVSMFQQIHVDNAP